MGEFDVSETLATPITQNYTSDEIRPFQLHIDAEKGIIRIESRTGYIDGGTWVEKSSNITMLRNEPDDEDGNPGDQNFATAMATTAYANWVKAQSPVPTFAACMRQAAVMGLTFMGVIA